MDTPTLVLVVWSDAWAESGDSTSVTEAHEKHRPMTMQTVGWVLREDESGISIFNERCLDQGEEVYRSRTFIPRAMVKSVTPVVKPRRKRTNPPPE